MVSFTPPPADPVPCLPPVPSMYRVFHIMKEEGGSEGGVVVQDCLELLNNLLRANMVRSMWRTSACAKYVCSMLVLL
jgi:hypothetical protein